MFLANLLISCILRLSLVFPLSYHAIGKKMNVYVDTYLCLSVEGVQNRTSKYVSLWHVKDIELKVIETL